MRLKIPIVTREANMSLASLRYALEKDLPKRAKPGRSKTNLMSMKMKAPSTMTKKTKMKKRMMISRAVLPMPAPSLLGHLSQALIRTYRTPSLKKDADAEGESRDKRRKSGKGALARNLKPKKVLI